MANFWNPRNDLMFKKIFGEPNKDILLNFLNAVFEGVLDPIESVSILPTHQALEIASFRQFDVIFPAFYKRQKPGKPAFA
jgi:hypothetical protein